MTQLSESVKAVYGSGFDAYRYLKRFFAFEYSLPEPDYDAFALMLVNDSILASTNLRVFSGLPEKSPPRSKTEIMAANFAVIAKAFNMDLRSQQQSFRYAEVAISAIADSEPFYCFYMFFWAALLHYNKVYFDLITNSSVIPLNLELERCHFVDQHISYSSFITNHTGGGRYEERRIQVSEVFGKYVEMTSRSIQQISRMEIDNEYPHSIRRSIQLNLPNIIYSNDRNNYPSFSQYPQLIKMAGQIK